MADRDRHNHHREGVECVGYEAEWDLIAIADAGHRQVGLSPNQRTVTAEAGAER